MIENAYSSVQCAADTTHLLFNNVPPQNGSLAKELPEVINRACQGHLPTADRSPPTIFDLSAARIPQVAEYI